MLAMNESKIRDSLLQQGINWKLNSPVTFHFGGVWERIILIVSKILYALMEKTKWRSLMIAPWWACLGETIINNQPITKSSSDPKYLKTITTNQPLLMKPGPQLFCGCFSSCVLGEVVQGISDIVRMNGRRGSSQGGTCPLMILSFWMILP